MNTRLALVLLPVATASCTLSLLHGGPDNAPFPDADFVQTATPLTCDDLDGLWARAEQVVGMEGYLIDGEETSFADRELVTRWNLVLAMNRYEGYRTRAKIRIRPVTKNTWSVGVQVQRQRNTDINNPSEPLLAKWEIQPADRARAGVILWKIESGFRAPGSEDAGGGKTN